MIVIYAELVLLAAAALISDIRTFKIKNHIIVVFIVAGLLTSFLLNGFPGLTQSIIAALLPVPLLIVLFALRMLGAGDIKLFCAVGAIAGIKFVLYSMAFSFVAGGIIAAVIMLVNKSFRQRGRYLAGYLQTCLLSGRLQPYTDFENKNDGTKFRFSYAVACGTVIVILLQIFQTI